VPSLSLQLLVYAFWCYGMKFFPSIMNVVFMASFNLRWICENLPNSTCSWVYPILPHSQSMGEVKPPPAMIVLNSDVPPPLRPTQCISTWSCENFSRLLYVQQFSVFFLVLYFGMTEKTISSLAYFCLTLFLVPKAFKLLFSVVISACFVYRSQYLWVRNPAANRVWLTTSLCVYVFMDIYLIMIVFMLMHQ
jgi:hypothetical protein